MFVFKLETVLIYSLMPTACINVNGGSLLNKLYGVECISGEKKLTQSIQLCSL